MPDLEKLSTFINYIKVGVEYENENNVEKAIASFMLALDYIKTNGIKSEDLAYLFVADSSDEPSAITSLN